MLFCLFIVFAGFALMFGATGLAERLVRAAIGLALILSALPALLCALRGVGNLHVFTFASSIVGVVALVVALAGVGLALWKARGLFAKRRDEAARRSSSPRERVAPPPPPADDADGEIGEP